MYGNTSHHESFVTEYWVKVKDKKYTKCLFSVSFYVKGTLEKLCCHRKKVLPSFLGGFISISLITLIYQMCLWWQLLWLIRVKKKKKILFAPKLIHVAPPNLSLLPLEPRGWVHLLYLVLSLVLYLAPNHLHQNESLFFEEVFFCVCLFCMMGCTESPVWWKEGREGKRGAW